MLQEYRGEKESPFESAAYSVFTLAYTSYSQSVSANLGRGEGLAEQNTDKWFSREHILV